MTTRRGQISVGCFAMPLACGTLILIMVVYCEFAVANLLFQSPCEAKKAYRQNIIGIAKTSMSRTECGLLCKKNDACNSFTYNRRSGLCLLSTGIEKNCNLLTNEADSQYFTALTPGCAGPSRQSLGRHNCTCSPGYYGSNCEINCGDGFFMLPGSGSCYHFSSIQVTWSQAKAYCEAKGAMLFCPETESELTVVRHFLKTKVFGDKYVYYGVTDAAQEGTWVCEGTGQTIATATGPGTGGPLFHSSQPDNKRGNQNCAYGRPADNFVLGDTFCDISAYFLCEKP